MSSLERQPAVVLLGPRQVGKTTLAHEVGEVRKLIYLDLESPEDLQKLSDPLLYLRKQENTLVVLDEIQRVPNLFPVLRGLIDERRRKGHRSGHFLLLGSASLDLMRQSSESLAGRIAQLELTPLTALEIEDKESEQTKLWVRGGFPNSFLEDDDSLSLKWRLDFIRTYLERDIPQLGPRIPAETLRRLWTMLAHLQGCLFNASTLAVSLGIQSQTVSRYVDLLVDLLLVRRLQPYYTNLGKRLVRSPKIYVRDSGILHALLGIRDWDSLLGHPILGASFESFVIENCLNCAPTHSSFYFYRTAAGAEIDLIVEFSDKTIWAIEIKRSLAPKLQRGFFHACEDIKPHKKFLIYPGEDRYFLYSDIEVIGLRAFLTELSQAS